MYYVVVVAIDSDWEEEVESIYPFEDEQEASEFALRFNTQRGISATIIIQGDVIKRNIFYKNFSTNL